MIYLVEYKGTLGWYVQVIRAKDLSDLLFKIKRDGSQYLIKACLGEGSL